MVGGIFLKSKPDPEDVVEYVALRSIAGIVDKDWWRKHSDNLKSVPVDEFLSGNYDAVLLAAKADFRVD